MKSYWWHLCIIMEKAYDRVNSKKLLELMRNYGVHGNLVGLIGRIYNGSMVIFALENMTTGWCKSHSGIRSTVPGHNFL